MRQPSHFPWEKFPQFEAIVHFARGIGSARSGDQEMAQQAHDQLDSLQNLLGDAPVNRYWANQIEIQKTAVRAWQTFAQGKRDEALKIMEIAAGLEESTEKNPITPGELLPAREMLGDMLLEMDQPEEALLNYQQSLKRNPNRFNTLYGAGKAAEIAGNVKETEIFFNRLLELAGSSAPKRTEIVYAYNKVNPNGSINK